MITLDSLKQDNTFDNLTKEIWDIYSMEEKTLVSYKACYLYLKFISKPTEKLFGKSHVLDNDIDHWFTSSHYNKWQKKCGNDWRGLMRKQLCE